MIPKKPRAIGQAGASSGRSLTATAAATAPPTSKSLWEAMGDYYSLEDGFPLWKRGRGVRFLWDKMFENDEPIYDKRTTLNMYKDMRTNPGRYGDDVDARREILYDRLTDQGLSDKQLR